MWLMCLLLFGVLAFLFAIYKELRKFSFFVGFYLAFGQRTLVEKILTKEEQELYHTTMATIKAQYPKIFGS